MFQIDLLQGAGLPERGRPLRILLCLLPMLAPVLLVLFLIVAYWSDQIELQTRQQKLQGYQRSQQERGELASFLTVTNQERDRLAGILQEVSVGLSTHRPWSGVIEEIVGSLPEAISLDRLEVKRRLYREKIPSRSWKKMGKPTASVEVVGCQYTLKLWAVGPTGAAGNEAIQTFLQNLRQRSTRLLDRDEIRLVSHQADREGKGNWIRYEIDWVFPPSMEEPQ